MYTALGEEPSDIKHGKGIPAGKWTIYCSRVGPPTLEQPLQRTHKRDLDSRAPDFGHRSRPKRPLPSNENPRPRTEVAANSAARPALPSVGREQREAPSLPAIPEPHGYPLPSPLGCPLSRLLISAFARCGGATRRPSSRRSRASRAAASKQKPKGERRESAPLLARKTEAERRGRPARRRRGSGPEFNRVPRRPPIDR